MGNDKLKTLDYFSCLPNHELPYVDLIWAKFFQIALLPENTLKQIKVELQMAFGFP